MKSVGHFIHRIETYLKFHSGSVGTGTATLGDSLFVYILPLHLDEKYRKINFLHDLA